MEQENRTNAPDTHTCPTWCVPTDCFGRDAADGSTAHVRSWRLTSRPEEVAVMLMQIVRDDGKVAHTDLMTGNLERLTAAECREMASFFEEAARIVRSIEESGDSSVDEPHDAEAGSDDPIGATVRELRYLEADTRELVAQALANAHLIGEALTDLEQRWQGTAHDD